MTAFQKPGATTLIAVILVEVGLMFFLQRIIWLAAPLFLALMLYYCVRPLVATLVFRGLHHRTAAAAAWLVLQMIAIVVVLAGTKAFATNGSSWPELVARYLAAGKALVSHASASLETVFPIFRQMELGSRAQHAVDDLTDHFAQKHLVSLAVVGLKSLPSMVLVPYMTYFLLTDSTAMKKYLIRSVPNAFFEKALLLVSRLDANLQSYFRGLMVVTFLDAFTLYLGLLVIGVPHAAVLSLAGAMLSWIPYLGSAAGLILIVLVAATDLPGREWAAYACVPLCLGVHLLDNFVYTPGIIGRTLDVHPLLNILLQFLGALVAGAWGLILALPLFAVTTIIGETVAEIVEDRRLRARHRAALHLGDTPDAS
jgi:predicted PurR-regulated permease PerM